MIKPQEGIDIMTMISNIWPSLTATMESIIKYGRDILVMLMIIEIIKSAIDLAVHQVITIDKKLIGYALVALLFFKMSGGSNYEYVAHTIFTTSISMVKTNYDKLSEIRTENIESLKKFFWKDSINNFSLNPGKMVSGFLGLRSDQIVAKIANFLASLLMAFGDVILLGIFVGYALLLFIGPFLIPFVLSPSTRSIAVNWLTNVLSNFLLFPMISLTIFLSNNLCKNAVTQLDIASTKYDFNSIKYYWDIFIIILLPLMLLMLTLQMSKSILHGGGGGVGGSILQPLTAAISIGMMAAGAATKVFASSKGFAAAGGGGGSQSKGSSFSPLKTRGAPATGGPMTANMSRQTAATNTTVNNTSSSSPNSSTVSPPSTNSVIRQNTHPSSVSRQGGNQGKR